MKRTILLALTLVFLLTSVSMAGCTPATDYTDLSVRDFVGKNGIVTAANPYAAKVGLDILQQGGNAFDAAVAVSFAMGVVEPDATGIGGGGLMIAYNVNSKQSMFYNFREFAPANATIDKYQSDYSAQSGKAIAVPTQVAGLLTILEEQGTMSRQEIIAPSVSLALDGVVVTPELAKVILDNFTVLQKSREETMPVFCIDGIEPLAEGDTLVQTDLADVLQNIADYGKEYFYTGEFAQKVVDAIQQAGGYVTMDDMKYALDNYPVKSTALTGSYNGYDILTVGSPSTGGTMLIEMLNMLESYAQTNGKISDLQHNSAEYINLIATVMQLAYGDKEKYMADATQVDVPLQGLTDKQYASDRMEKYTAGQAYLGTASGDTAYGDPWKYQTEQGSVYSDGESGDHYSTTSFSIIDKEGNIVTFTQTINSFFGTGYVPEGTGFFLNNEINDFSTQPDSINAVAPYKQPASYMMPTVVLKDNKPYATLGSPGGSRIPSAVLQVLLNLIEFDMDIQSAISAPRVYCFTTDDGDVSATAKGIYIENALKEIENSLVAMNYNVLLYGDKQYDSYFGGVQGIKVTDNGYHGGADPRRDGKALGY